MGNIFSPKTKIEGTDGLSKGFLVLAKYIFLVIFGFLPILFIPNSLINLDYNKTFLAFSAVFVVSILFSLNFLRTGKIKFTLPFSIWLFWLLILWMLASAFLSLDRVDAIFGNFLEVQTVGFFILLASVLTLVFKLAESKKFVVNFLLTLSFSFIVLLLFQTFRFFWGEDFLSLGILKNNSETLFGNPNNLAVIGGLVVVICLSFLQDFGRGVYEKISISTILFLALFILSVVNFRLVWFCLLGFSLIFLSSSFLKETWVNKNPLERAPKIALFTSFLVTILAVGFLFSSNLGNYLNDKFKVNYSEILPSTESTLGILQSVYQEDILLGVGPNRFEDAWRLHKDPQVNLTNFWNLDFLSGSNFILTFLVSTGVVGGILFLVFIFSFLKTGFEVLFLKTNDKNNLHGVQNIVFSAGFYLWLMIFLFNPNSSLLILAILMTGLFLALTRSLVEDEKQVLEINMLEKRRFAPLFLTGVIIFLIGSSWFFVNLTKQYLAENSYQQALLVFKDSRDFLKTDKFLETAYNFFPSDVFLVERAKLRLANLNNIISENSEELSESELMKFQDDLIAGLGFTNEAISLDKTNPYNYLLLINFYRILGVEGNREVQDSIEVALKKVESLDPTNVDYKILSARLFVDKGDYETARKILQGAVNLKNNHTETFLLLAQLAIKENLVEETTFEVQELLKIDPKNPARYLELGILLSDTEKKEEAVKAFQKAIELDPYYADARYFLAVLYFNLEEKEKALEQLYKAKETNQDNRELLQLISEIESSL